MKLIKKISKKSTLKSSFKKLNEKQMSEVKGGNVLKTRHDTAFASREMI